MNLNEYNNVKNMTYLEYCDYLQSKYGKSNYDYMSENFKKNPKVTRTKEGLFCHHKFEDHAILLSHPEYAMQNPFYYQKAENLVYCDFLEHLFLHILITEYPAEDKNENENVGIGGCINFFIPELNDLYSGFNITQQWKLNCFNKVKDDVDVDVSLVKRLISRLNILTNDNEIIKSIYIKKYVHHLMKIVI